MILTEFWKLNATCNISPEIAELRIWTTLNKMRQTHICWRAGLLNVKEKGMPICYIMTRCLLMFLRGGEVNVVVYWWNIVAKLNVNKASLSKLLSNQKQKILLYQVNYFVIGVKPNFFWLQTNCIDDQDKVYSVTDTDNKFTDCQKTGKKLQSIGISLASLHSFMETLKSNILEVSKVQVDCLKDS